jgi:hypothetical protein
VRPGLQRVRPGLQGLRRRLRMLGRLRLRLLFVVGRLSLLLDPGTLLLHGQTQAVVARFDPPGGLLLYV